MRPDLTAALRAGAVALALTCTHTSPAPAVARPRQYDVPFVPCEPTPPPPWTVRRLTAETPVQVADGLHLRRGMPTPLHLHAQSRHGFHGVEHEVFWVTGGKKVPVPGSLVRDGIVTDGAFELDLYLPASGGGLPGLQVLELAYRQAVARDVVLGCVRFVVRVE